MNDYSKQMLGILIGIISAMVGFFLLEPIKFRYVLGILFTSAGILFLGVCAYHLKEAKRNDLLYKSKQEKKKKGVRKK